MWGPSRCAQSCAGKQKSCLTDGRESPLESRAESLLGKTRTFPLCQGSLLTETEVTPFYLEMVQGGKADLLRCL